MSRCTTFGAAERGGGGGGGKNIDGRKSNGGPVGCAGVGIGVNADLPFRWVAFELFDEELLIGGTSLCN